MKTIWVLFGLIGFLAAAAAMAPAALPAQNAGSAETAAQEAARKAEEAARAAGKAAGEAAQKAAERARETARDAWLGEDGLSWPLIRFRRLAGSAIDDAQGRELGTVQDVALTGAGEAVQAVLQVNGGGDLPAGQYLVPAGRILRQGGRLRLASGPFDRERILPSGEGLPSRRIGTGSVLASRLLDFQVRGPDGKEAGRIDDVVLDLQARRVAYAALGTGGVLGLEQKRIAVPFGDVPYDLSQGTVQIEATAAQLQKVPGFPRDRWPARANESWKRQAGAAGAGQPSGEQQPAGPAGSPAPPQS